MNKRLKIFLIAINILLVLLTLGAYLSPHVHPTASALLPVLGLGYPALFVSNCIALAVWLVVDKKWVWLSFVTLLIGYNSCSRILNFSLASTPSKHSFTVASYNVNFSKPIAFAPDSDRVAMEQGFEAYLKENDDIEILCVQEHGWRSRGHILEAMNFKFRHEVADMTVAIYSKFPIVNRGVVDFNSNIANTCLWVDVETGSDTIRVYATHLESNRFDGTVPDIIEQEAPEVMSNSALFGIVRHYQKFTGERVAQAAHIQAHRKTTAFASIICGDMNDTPQSHVYTIVRDDMKDSFMSKGCGLGSTFGEKIPALRIDHIFVDQKIKVLDHEISRNNFSDHFLLRTELEL